MNPKITYYDNGNKEYEECRFNGQYHKEDGPSFQHWYDNGNKRYEEYFINGKECKKEDTFLNKPSKTINIKGKEISEDTILLALKNYFKDL